MVCLPCIVVPVLLYIWHRFLQPIVIKFWNPFGAVDQTKKNEEDAKNGSTNTDDVLKNGDVKSSLSCPFKSSDTDTTNSAHSPESKKNE